MVNRQYFIETVMVGKQTGSCQEKKQVRLFQATEDRKRTLRWNWNKRETVA